MMPIIALVTSIFVGWFLKPKTVIEEAELEGNKLSKKGMFSVIIRYIAPVMLVVILVPSVLDGFGILKI